MWVRPTLPLVQPTLYQRWSPFIRALVVCLSGEALLWALLHPINTVQVGLYVFGRLLGQRLLQPLFGDAAASAVNPAPTMLMPAGVHAAAVGAPISLGSPIRYSVGGSPIDLGSPMRY